MDSEVVNNNNNQTGSNCVSNNVGGSNGFGSLQFNSFIKYPEVGFSFYWIEKTTTTVNILTLQINIRRINIRKKENIWFLVLFWGFLFLFVYKDWLLAKHWLCVCVCGKQMCFLSLDPLWSAVSVCFLILS